MAFEGMDVDQVEHYGNQLLTEAGNIGNLINQIQGHVTTLASNWLGTDSTEFQGEWSNTYLHQLQKAQTDLHDLGQSALNNATEQRDASSHL